MRAAKHPEHMSTQENKAASAVGVSDFLDPAPLPEPKGGPVLAVVRPRRFPRVPTHVVGVANEQRVYPRAALSLPLRLCRVAGQREEVSVTLLTKNISSSGVYFLCPRQIAPGTPIELEVGLIERPLGRGSVRMTTAAHVVRVEPAETLGWFGLAATFDDISFHRDEAVPLRLDHK